MTEAFYEHDKLGLPRLFLSEAMLEVVQDSLPIKMLNYICSLDSERKIENTAKKLILVVALFSDTISEIFYTCARNNSVSLTDSIFSSRILPSLSTPVLKQIIIGQ